MNTLIKQITIGAATLAFGALIVAPGMAVTSKIKAKTHSMTMKSVAWPQICPMTGNKIASAKDSVGTSTYKGKTFYFCCEMCKPEFDKNPAKYSAMAAKHQYGLKM